jgi:protoporphyrinogen oxidase
LLRSKLGDNYRIASAAFIWAIISRLYRARQSGMKREVFGYVSGGYARILGRMEQYLGELGVATVLDADVQEVTSAPNSVVVSVAGGSMEFDCVVVTAASPIAARLIPGLEVEERRMMEQVTYQGIICASVLARRPLAGFYVTNLTDSGFPFTGVIEMTSLVDPQELGGKHLIYLPRYTTQDDEALTWSDAEVERAFLSGLRAIHPTFEPQDVEAFQVSRVRYVLPVSTLGYSTRVPPTETSLPGIFTVNSSQILNGTLNVNETLQLAEAAMAALTNGQLSRATQEQVA